MTFFSTRATTSAPANGNDEALALFRELEVRQQIANVLRRLGHAARTAGDVVRATTMTLESLSLYREVEDVVGAVEALETLAGVAAMRERPELAVRWLAAAQAERERLRSPLPPVYQPEQAEQVETLRRLLGASDFSAFWTQGTALTVDQAADQAMNLSLSVGVAVRR